MYKKNIWWHCVDAFSKRATLSSGWGWPFTSQDVSQFLHVHYGDSWHLLVVQELNGLLRVCSTGSKIDLAALEVKARLARPMGWLSYDWQEEMKVRSDFLHCGAEGRKVELLFSLLPEGNVWRGLWTKCSPSTRREPIRHRGRGPRPWCSARRWGRWRCPPGWRWSWTRRPPCSRNKMFSKRAWLTAEQIYRLCQRKFKCSRRTNSSLICTGGGKKKNFFWVMDQLWALWKICVRPVEVPDQRLGLLSEMSDRKWGNSSRLVPGMFKEHFLFYQPEQEGEAPLQAAAATACRYRRRNGEGILSLHHNIIRSISIVVW